MYIQIYCQPELGYVSCLFKFFSFLLNQMETNIQTSTCIMKL